MRGVFLLNVPTIELNERLLARGRSDDQPEVIKKRMSIYEEKTKPVSQYYRKRGLLFVIDGSKAIENVIDDIVSTILRFV